MLSDELRANIKSEAALRLRVAKALFDHERDEFGKFVKGFGVNPDQSIYSGDTDSEAGSSYDDEMLEQGVE